MFFACAAAIALAGEDAGCVPCGGRGSDEAAAAAAWVSGVGAEVDAWC